MTDQMKLYWKLYLEWFPNNKILSGFDNPIKSYCRQKTGKVIDIGCGQSAYLLDLLDSDFELYAVDTEETQLEFFKERVEQFGYEKNRVSYSAKEFPSEDFKDSTFSAIIMSNLLHFFPKPTAYHFAEELINYCIPGSLISVTVHSSGHLSSNKEIDSESYFKSFYSKADLYDMFPDKEFEYLSFIEKESYPSNYKIDFLKYWINEFYKEKYLPFQIRQIQENYLKGCRVNSIDFLVRKK